MRAMRRLKLVYGISRRDVNAKSKQNVSVSHTLRAHARYADGRTLTHVPERSVAAAASGFWNPAKKLSRCSEAKGSLGNCFCGDGCVDMLQVVFTGSSAAKHSVCSACQPDNRLSRRESRSMSVNNASNYLYMCGAFRMVPRCEYIAGRFVVYSQFSTEICEAPLPITCLSSLSQRARKAGTG
jgi:hypothetical protein